MKNLTITPENKVKVISTGATLGGLSCNDNGPVDRRGWRFIPYTTAHTSSRKCHATAEKAIPAWVKRHALARLRELREMENRDVKPVARAQFDTEAEARIFIAGIEMAKGEISVDGLYRKNGKFYVQVVGMDGTIHIDTAKWIVKKG